MPRAPRSALAVLALTLACHGRSAAEPPADPLARWLAGAAGGKPWPPEVLADAVRAAGGNDVVLDSTKPAFRRTRDGLTVWWQGWIQDRQWANCGPILGRVRKALAAAKLTGDGAELGSTADGVTVRVKLDCRPAVRQAAPGCTGGSCDHPTTLELVYTEIIPAPPWKTLAEALAPFPTLGQATLAAMVPEFVAHAVDAAGAKGVGCERWAAGRCEDLRLLVAVKGDPRAWALALFALASTHGYKVGNDTRWPLTTYQACSDQMMYVALADEGGVELILLRYGSAPGSHPDAVSCSAHPDGPRP